MFYRSQAAFIDRGGRPLKRCEKAKFLIQFSLERIHLSNWKKLLCSFARFDFNSIRSFFHRIQVRVAKLFVSRMFHQKKSFHDTKTSNEKQQQLSPNRMKSKASITKHNAYTCIECDSLKNLDVQKQPIWSIMSGNNQRKLNISLVNRLLNNHIESFWIIGSYYELLEMIGKKPMKTMHWLKINTFDSICITLAVQHSKNPLSKGKPEQDSNKATHSFVAFVSILLGMWFYSRNINIFEFIKVDSSEMVRGS